MADEANDTRRITEAKKGYTVSPRCVYCWNRRLRNEFRVPDAVGGILLDLSNRFRRNPATCQIQASKTR